MATQYLKFTGTAEWAKVWPGQIDREFVDDSNPRDKGGNWSVVLTLDGDDLKLFNAVGSKAKLKDGNKATFRRYEKASFGLLTAPVVTGVDEGTSIGNGSTVTVEVEVYDYSFKGKPGKAFRLRSVHVDKLVEYKRPDAAGAPAAGSNDMDDAVPF